jgi:cytochrome c oxidase assembly factor CtaG
VDSKLVVAIVALILGLPTGLISAALLAPRRGRFLQFLGALVAAVVAGAASYAYATTISVDLLSYGVGAYLVIATGAVMGGLGVSFLLSLGGRRSGSAQIGR